MRTRAQEWSARAYDRVSGVAARGADHSKAQAKYKTSCMKMPGLIKQCGLLQALVFQVARDEWGESYVDHLAQAYFRDDPKADHRKLIAHAQKQDISPYMALTHDVAQVAQWFRRFAQIEFATADVGE